MPCGVLKRFSLVEASLCIFLMLLFVHLSALPSAYCEDASGDDFGSETIDIDSAEEALPVPVELVEEKDPSQQAATLDESMDQVLQAEGTEEEAARKPDAEAQGQTDTTSFLNVNDMDIPALVKLISKQTRRNYIIDSEVKGKITIHQETPVTMEEALGIFETVLQLKGFTTVPVGNNIWKVVKAKDAKETTIPLVMEDEANPSHAMVTRLMRLRYTQAADMQQLLSQFVSKDGMLNSYSGTNALIMIDSEANIRRLAEIIKELDVPAVDQDLTVIPVEHAEATDVAEKIEAILGEDDDQDQSRTQSAVSRQVPRRAISPLGQRTTGTGESQSVERRMLPFKIIPDERTNSLIVVADPEMTLKVQTLVERLDSPVDRSGGRFYVYRLEHADAEELAQILEQVVSGAASEREGTTTSRTRGSSITRSRSETTTPNAADRARARLAAVLRGRTDSGIGGTEDERGKVNLEGEVFIAPDPATNSLIINASRADYQRLKEVIEALDIKRRQVLVEATILEVSLTEEEGMGIELQGTAGTDQYGVVGQTNFGGLTNLLTNPSALSDLTIAAASTGTLTLPGGLVIPSQAALISAVSSNDNVNILSTPTIVATDNEEAEIIVGENVPFVTSTSTDSSNINNTFNQIDRQDVGITLRITPQISSGNFIMLNIFVEISNVVPGTRTDPNGPTTTIRTTETRVEVKDGQMVATGGLISDSVTQATQGVPFFQDIPVIGNYFKREDQNRRRTNLLILITPRVVTNQFDAREHTTKFTHHMEQVIDEQGSQHPRREVLDSKDLDNVVESLPSGDVLPTTVIPPQDLDLDAEERGAWERTQRRLGALAPAPSVAPHSPIEPSADEPRTSPPQPVHPEEDVIDISVSPKLPGVPEQDEVETADVTPLSVGSRDSQEATYVVLQDVSETALPDRDKAGFRYANPEGILALAVVGSLSSPAGRFFNVGGRYAYRVNGVERHFVCLGRYASEGEARTLHEMLGNPGAWNRLSPQETLSLGRGAWMPE